MKLKKFLLSVATFITVTVLCMIGAGAETLTSGDYEYDILTDGTVSVTKYNGTATSLTIPSSIDGKVVSTIGEKCFYNNYTVKSITIPESVKNIGGYAFGYCGSLASVSIPDTVEKIDSCAFYYCSRLSEINLPATLTTLAGDALYLCTGLTSVTVDSKNPSYCSVNGILFDKKITKLIAYPPRKPETSYIVPSTVTTIAEKAFYSSYFLETITFSGSTTVLGKRAFASCKALKSVILPEGPATLGDYLFNNSTELESVHLPDSLTALKNDIFLGCDSFTSFIVNDSNPFFCTKDGVLYSKDMTKLVAYPVGKSDTSFAVPENVLHIGDYAFYHATKIEKLTFGKKLLSFGNFPFSNCSNLTSVAIPESLTDYGRATFDGCGNLTEITIPSKVTKLSDYTFRDCKKLTKIEIKGVIKEIRSYCFTRTPITSIYFPEGLEKVHYNAFSDCPNLVSVSLPDTITEMGPRAFQNTPFQNNNTDDLKYIGNVLYCVEADVTDAVVKEGTTVIAKNIFEVCTDLETIVLPDSLTVIPDSCFSRCYTLKKITFGSDTKSIGSGAFTACYSLQEITIPESMDSIPDYAFSSCTALTSIVIPGNIKSIGEYAFQNCSSLESVVLCRGITDMASCIFANCHKLTNIRIPDGVTSLEGTFYNCLGLEKLTIPDSAVKFNSITIAGTPKSHYLHCSPDSAFYDFINTRYHEAITNGYMREIDELTPVSINAKSDGTSIILSWNNTPSTEGVEIQQLINSEWKTITTIADGSKGTYIVSGLTIGNKYSFRARTYSYTGTTTLYSVYTYKDAFVELGGVTGLTGTTTSSSATLSWNKVIGATGYIIEQYKDNAWTEIADITSNETVTYKATGLIPGTTYEFRIRAYAVSDAGNELYSNYTSTLTAITLPSAITGFSNPTKYSNSLVLSWNKNTSADGYKIQQMKNGVWTTITTITSNATTSYTVTGLAPSTTYYFRMIAYKNAYGNTYYSSFTGNMSAITLPGAVTGFSNPTKYSNSLVLSWNKNTSADGYKIQQMKNDAWTTIATITSNATTSYTVTGLAPSTTYYFRMIAYKNAYGNTYYSSFTGNMSAITLPSAVTGFSNPTKYSNGLVLSWNKNTSADGYKIQQMKNGVWTTIATISGNTNTSYTVTGLAPSTTYYFRMIAYKNAYGNTYYSSFTGNMSAITLPGAVTGFSNPTKYSNSLVLSWNKNTSADGYKIQQMKNGVWTTIATISGNANTSYTVTGLAPSTTYNFRMIAYKNAYGNTYYSSFTGNMSAITLPSAITGFTNSAKSSNTLTLSWNKNTSADGYKIQQMKNGVWTTIATISGNTNTSYTVTGLAPSTTYYFRMIAYNNAYGNTYYSSFTSAISATTKSS